MSAVTDATFQQVLDAPLAVVDFWAPSCPYCVKYKPDFEAVAAQMAGQIFMATANTDEAPRSAAESGISAIPVTIFYRNGQEVHRVDGAMTQQDLLSEISRALSIAETTPAPAESAGSVVVGGIALAGVVAGLAYLASELG
jgi:thioredoxin-like negative regulator of GroEL